MSHLGIWRAKREGEEKREEEEEEKKKKRKRRKEAKKGMELVWKLFLYGLARISME